MKYWKQLTVDYMSDESDDPADSYTLVIHPLPWRSERKACIDVAHMSSHSVCNHAFNICTVLWPRRQESQV